MDEIQRQALAWVRQAIIAEIDARGGGQALYALARRWAGTAWERGMQGQRGDASAGAPPGDAPALAAVWAPLLTPIGAGVADELEARITTLVRPTVEKAAVIGGAGGLLVGYQIAKWLK